jgi:UDP-N-acetylglucosamine--N-acetylmuramyl-(pentapeptide) pyrophosphoryl-undecaprenol N-acetylglucosamine transferase
VPRVLYGVSPIGLGHATRALVVVDALKKRGVDVAIFSGGRAAQFIRDLGYSVEDIVDDPVPSAAKGEMRRVALWYVRSWFAYKRSLKRTERLFDNYAPDLVVCDEEFTGIAIAEKRGRKRVFVSDELQLGFARSWMARAIERRVERWYRRLQEKVDLLIIPEFGADEGNKRHVGPIVRPPTLSGEDARRKYGLPPGRMILFSMSGSGIGQELLAKLANSMEKIPDRGTFLVIAGNRGPRMSAERVYDLGLVPDNQNLVASADLVISTAGKSTIDEAAASGVPIIAIPIRFHAEQERNARELGYTADDSARLGVLIAEKLGKKSEPRQFSGQDAACSLILSLL